MIRVRRDSTTWTAGLPYAQVCRTLRLNAHILPVHGGGEPCGQTTRQQRSMARWQQLRRMATQAWRACWDMTSRTARGVTLRFGSAARHAALRCGTWRSPAAPAAAPTCQLAAICRRCFNGQVVVITSCCSYRRWTNSLRYLLLRHFGAKGKAFCACSRRPYIARGYGSHDHVLA